MNKTSLYGWILAISGGFGLGLTLGSEFQSELLRYIGIGILLVVIILIGFLNYLDK